MGFGDIVPVNHNEKIFNILVYIVGTIIYAIVVVHLHGIVAQLDVTSDIFKSRKNRVKSFMIRESFSEAMVKRVNAHHERQWAVQRGAEGSEIKSFLPQSIYANIVYTTIHENLSRTFLFKNPSVSLSFKNLFVSKLTLEIYNKDDVFFHTGEIPNKLYFLVQGEIAYVPDKYGTCSGKALNSKTESEITNSNFKTHQGALFGLNSGAGNSTQSNPVEYGRIVQGECIGEYEFFTR